MMEQAKVFKVESFGAVDGPGIRLVLFLQGCGFRCKYCHNPESWNLDSPDAKLMSADDVIAMYNRNKSFYDTGGITLSGGDPMVQPDFVLALAKKCHEQKIHLTIDTSACTIGSQQEYYEKLLPYVNLWLVDIKALDADHHKYITGSADLTGLKLINLLEKNNKPYWVRCVIVHELNDDQEQLDHLAQILANFKHMEKYELIPYHDMGKQKYHDLNIDYPLEKTLVLSYAQHNKIVNTVKQAIEKYKKV